MNEKESDLRKLPTILYQGKKYFVDHKIHKMFNVNNPQDNIQY
jgi:hypothetical protein